ncbi:hypothetical protein ACIA3K_24070 [Micromonospora sp. NPDC051543]|uniref:hypothetical protein n=1 Tax=Micromonospora sp. NPDC051543 TaxID=3364287 RepID=UPI003791370B
MIEGAGDVAAGAAKAASEVVDAAVQGAQKAAEGLAKAVDAATKAGGEVATSVADKVQQAAQPVETAIASTAVNPLESTGLATLRAEDAVGLPASRGFPPMAGDGPYQAPVIEPSTAEAPAPQPVSAPGVEDVHAVAELQVVSDQAPGVPDAEAADPVSAHEVADVSPDTQMQGVIPTAAPNGAASAVTESPVLAPLTADASAPDATPSSEGANPADTPRGGSAPADVAGEAKPDGGRESKSAALDPEGVHDATEHVAGIVVDIAGTDVHVVFAEVENPVQPTPEEVAAANTPRASALVVVQTLDGDPPPGLPPGLADAATVGLAAAIAIERGAEAIKSATSEASERVVEFARTVTETAKENISNFLDARFGGGRT